MVRLKRVYDPVEKTDGYRVLVDRLWPRGLSKDEAVIDEWAKELAPTSELRKEFAHNPEKWRWFQSEYKKELAGALQKEQVAALAKRAEHSTVTLLYGAKDTKHNNALVVKAALEKMLNGKNRTRARKTHTKKNTRATKM